MYRQASTRAESVSWISTAPEPAPSLIVFCIYRVGSSSGGLTDVLGAWPERYGRRVSSGQSLRDPALRVSTFCFIADNSTQ